MHLGIDGKTALVGGASRGLGRAIAERLAVEGAHLVLCARHAAPLEESALAISGETGTPVLPVTADLSRADDVNRLIEQATERFGTIDILVHNTGGPPAGGFLDHDDASWEEAFKALLLSFVRLCRLVVPGMRAQGWGRIVTTTSFTVREPAEGLVLSNALRTGVVSASKTLAREVAADGITVHCVAQGAFETGRLRALFESQAAASGRTVEDVRRAWIDRLPIGRIPEPDELAGLVAFLCSDVAGAMTGACVPIDGGMTHGLF